MFTSISRFSNLNLFISILIGISAVLGDLIVAKMSKFVERAIADNATHAVIGGLSWMIVVNNFQYYCDPIQKLVQICFCTFLSSLIDFDHLLVAKSFSLATLQHLPRRGFAHCTTIAIIIWLLLLTTSRITQKNSWNLFGWISFTAFLSHQIRDGTRHGLWFCPFPDNKHPIPYYIYIMLNMILPQFMSLGYNYTYIPTNEPQRLEV